MNERMTGRMKLNDSLNAVDCSVCGADSAELAVEPRMQVARKETD
jgi:uncharacterized membrane protein YadS